MHRHKHWFQQQMRQMRHLTVPGTFARPPPAGGHLADSVEHPLDVVEGEWLAVDDDLRAAPAGDDAVQALDAADVLDEGLLAEGEGVVAWWGPARLQAVVRPGVPCRRLGVPS